MTEIIPIIDHPGYFISSLGVVYNKDMVPLSSFYRGTRKKKYICVDLHDKRLSIHRLVGIHFIPNIDNKPQLNHMDGIKENNWRGNLEWSTGSENMLHAWANGLTNRPRKKQKRVGEGLEFPDRWYFNL